MFALSDFAWFKSEKAASKILKPWWDVVTDYLVVGLLMISLLIGGMEVASGNFDCLPAVDCPVSNVSKWLSLVKHHNVCTVLYNNRKGAAREDITTVVPTKNFPLQYAKYVNSECSKNPIHWFHSHLSLILFIQAMVLLVFDNIWLKFPTTATLIENFSALVVECYNSPGTDISLSLALQGKTTNGHEPSGSEQNENGDDKGQTSSTSKPLLRRQQKSNHNTSTASSGRHGGVSVDDATVAAANTLQEKVKRFKRRIESSKKIGRIYLGKTVLQICATLASFIVNVVHYEELEGKIKCSVDEYIPFVHEYFICSHNLILAFKIASGASLLLLVANLIILFIILIWTCGKVREGKYDFKEKLSKWPENVVRDGAEADMGFLLHLLHDYNELYVVRFALYMSNDHEKAVRAYFLNSVWTLEKLRRERTNDGKKLSLSKLPGIPTALFYLQELQTLELIECEPLQDDDFKQFIGLTSLTTISLCDCSLAAIPKTIFDMVQLKTLALQRNQIESLPNDIEKLENLNVLDVSSNRLQTIDEAIKNLPALFTLRLLDNLNLQGAAIKHVLANKCLRVLKASPLTEEQKSSLTPNEIRRYESLRKETS